MIAADGQAALVTLDSLAAEVITDNVSDSYVSKTLFAVSEFSNVVMAGAKVISGETLLCANLGFGLKLVSEAENVRHTLLFDTGPEGTIFIRNCANLGIRLGEVESVAVSHGHWDHMAALPHAVEAIVKDGGRVAVHVNPDMFNERAIRLNTRVRQLEKRLSEILGEQAWRESGLGVPADIDALNQQITHLEQKTIDLHLKLEERDEELAAARAANRELMAQLNATPRRP